MPFEVVDPHVDESPLPAELPEHMAARLAEAKARAAAGRSGGAALVIGSDQVAVLDGAALGKPGTHGAAVDQLRKMRGRETVFHTAVCLLDTASGKAAVRNVPTRVLLRALTDAEIEAYLAREQPYDCAGSARIESLGIALAERVESTDPTALIGLPLISVTSMLRARGVRIL